MTDTKVRTRFAPSPTGYLHVGGARTALFSYLIARRAGGTFIVRIEDTDVERHQEDAVAKIVEDLRWLGLNWDEGIEVGGPAQPYRQSQRLEIYRQYIQKLLDAGQAYYAFETAEELDAARKAAEAAKGSFRYIRPAVLPAAADARGARAAGRPVVVRFLCPSRDVTVHDDIFGDVTTEAAQTDDFIIQKADGYPTFHLANVVDDALMGVTYIMRGQEFLGQTWRHVLLREALGFAQVRCAHLPLIMDMQGKKLSKRDKHNTVRKGFKDLMRQGKWTVLDIAKAAGCDDATAAQWLEGVNGALDAAQLESLAREGLMQVPEIEVHDFRKSGYLPEVLVNFIALQGWSPPGERERLSLPELVEQFSVERIGKSNARFDRTKLLAFNTDACASAGPARLLAAFKDYLALNPSPIPAGDDELLLALIKANHGLRTFADIVDKSAVLFVADDAYAFDPKAVDKVLAKNNGEGYAVLTDLAGRLSAMPAWTVESVQQVIDGYAAEKSLPMGKIAQPLRVAVTGRAVSPPIYETLTILGRDKTLARIDRCRRAR